MALPKEEFHKGVLSAGRLKAFQDCTELKEVDRHTLSSLVRRIYVYEGRRVELVQHCGNNDEYSTRYFRHRRVVVGQRCTRHRLLPPPCADENIVHCIHRYFRNAVLEFYFMDQYQVMPGMNSRQAQARHEVERGV